MNEEYLTSAKEDHDAIDDQVPEDLVQAILTARARTQ